MSTDFIGNVTTIYLKTTDTLENTYETNISKGFAVNPAATYAQVDTAVRALNQLTTNTYDDTTLVTAVSLNEVMAG